MLMLIQVTSLGYMYPRANNYHMKSAVEQRGPDGSTFSRDEDSGRKAHQLASGPFDLRCGYV
jgi:hypothetical protein